MKCKYVATVLALVMCLGAVVIAVDADDSDAATAGSMNIYIYDGSSWSDYPAMAGYNALQALKATGLSITADEDYVVQKTNDYGSYDEINSNYGNISAIGTVTETTTSVWNTICYNDGWAVGPDAIGFITPFTDGAAASANVVLYYGADITSVPTDVSNYLAGKTLATMITPSGSNYQYTFYLKIDADTGATPVIADGTSVTYKNAAGRWTSKTLTADDLSNGITVRGVGSNAYAALKNAVGSSNVSGTDTAGAYNGWLNTMFNLGTVSGANYIYWVQNTDADAYLSFNLGAYSTLDNVPTDTNCDFVESSFKLIYSTYVYS